ncbi:MAG: polyprenyl synthetase family protein, partial [Verrucomicrobiota bacterium]
AMRYMMKVGGKRLRPVLVVVVARALGAQFDPLPAAIAIECLHNYSLAHDDLPSIDNSDLRRGKATCHRAYDEATAILVGDALLTYAFELIAEHYADAPEVVAQLVQVLAHAASSRRLIGGQVEDIAADHGAPDPDLIYIQVNKTGAMLAASLEFGCILAGADGLTRDAAQATGIALGRAYQIVDDILDHTADEATLGKTQGLDARNAKRTWLTEHGLEGSRRDVAKLTKNALAQSRQIGEIPFLEALIAQLEHRAH